MITKTETITATSTGPITLDVQLDNGTIRVTVEDCDRAEVTVTGAERVDHTETGGALRVRPICPSGTFVSGNGIVVQGGRGVSVAQLAGRANIRCVSGDIRVHATAASVVRASAVSGNVTTTRAPGVDVDVDASSVSGRVRTR